MRLENIQNMSKYYRNQPKNVENPANWTKNIKKVRKTGTKLYPYIAWHCLKKIINVHFSTSRPQSYAKNFIWQLSLKIVILLLTTLPHKEFFGPLNWPKVTKGSWQGVVAKPELKTNNYQRLKESIPATISYSLW